MIEAAAKAAAIKLLRRVLTMFRIQSGTELGVRRDHSDALAFIIVVSLIVRPAEVEYQSSSENSSPGKLLKATCCAPLLNAKL